MSQSKVYSLGILAALIWHLGGATSIAARGKGASAIKMDPVPARIASGKPDETPPVNDHHLELITEHTNVLGQTVYSIKEIRHDVSLPLSEMIKNAPLDTSPGNALKRENLAPPDGKPYFSPTPDSVAQTIYSGEALALPPGLNPPAIGLNIAGLGVNGGYPPSVIPPDANGSVGNGQYVETVNTAYAVYDTATGNRTLGPLAINTLWTGFGGACQTSNDGAPIVLFDKAASRWFISQSTRTSPYTICIAVSSTANATGAYSRYSFSSPGGNISDTPKFGVWSDGYYMMANQFDTLGSFVGALYGVFDRARMVSGAAATGQFILDPLEAGQLPADLDGFAPPPTGAPGIFMSLRGGAMRLYRMKVDWTTPANTLRTVQADLPIAAYTDACTACIPQPGSATTLTSLSGQLMFRLAYRNLIDHESLVVSHTVDPSVTGVAAGVRWYEFRLSGAPTAVCSAYPCTYQQGTLADVANGRSRWVGSMAIDTAGNMILGYSTSGKTANLENHSIRATSRAAADPLGIMPGPELTLATGNRNNGGPRWGDYTSMSVDPADDCTLWYANEYYTTAGTTTWNTRISALRFPAGSGAGQCPDTTCAARPTTPPTLTSVAPGFGNQLIVTWNGMSPLPGSYAIERAVGSCANPGYYQPLSTVSGAATNFTDNTVQGGFSYAYRVVAAADGAGKCQGLTFSNCGETVPSGNCTVKPAFAGATRATSTPGFTCGVTINWTPAVSGCPLTPAIRYNIFRGTRPDFIPSPANRIALCSSDPSSYLDAAVPAGGVTYYYAARAEDDSSGNGGECGGGNEETNTVVVPGTAYGPGQQPSTGTWYDDGGDTSSFMEMNRGSSIIVWRSLSTATDAGANHTPGGSLAYRTAGPFAISTYADQACADIRSPALTTGAGSVALSYWTRYNQEWQWDGVMVEYSKNNAAWTSVPAPAPATDWGPLAQTQNPPINACGYLATGSFGYTGPNPNPVASTPYAQRTHTLAGFADNDIVAFRWRSSSDLGVSYTGFYLDDIAVGNIHLPNSCATGCPFPSAPTWTAANPLNIARNAAVLNFTWPAASAGTTSYANYSAATPNPGIWTLRSTTASLAWANGADYNAAGSLYYTLTATNCFGESPK